MPVPKLPLYMTGLLYPYHLAWWRRTLRSRSVLTPWNQAHQALFIHIPKTAGTSVLASLGAPPVFDTHAPARALAYSYPDFFAQAYKFAFVRNPWDRFSSAFHFMKHGTDWPMQQQWAERNIGDMDFPEFTHRLRSPMFRAQVMAERFFWPQCFWLRGCGRIDLLRFERLEEEVMRVGERLSIDRAPSLPHMRKSAKPDFRTLYDDRMIDIVADLYRQDITALDYRFEA
jgi:hypothetical protein